MAIEHHFYMDTSASRHELRDTLVRADIGLEIAPDWESTSGASSMATNVVILDDLSRRVGRPDNGVVATRSVMFRMRKNNWEGFYTQIVRGVMALLKAYPKADAYWEGWDAEIPLLLRRGGRLMLSQALTEPGEFWDSGRQPSRVALVDLPYTVEPLGPWAYVPVAAQGPDHRPRSAAR